MQQLAHPLFGVINMEARPVDCATEAPLPPNFISSTLFDDQAGIQPG